MLSRFFIDRPIFATVVAIVTIIVGGVASFLLPIAQYPEVVPPTVSVATTYPGASASVVADTVATPLEQQVNGVENMLYMSSVSGNDGSMTLNVTFKLGTDLNMAQVLTQNRVSIALAQLPDEVKRQGVVTKKKSPSILLAINLISKKNERGEYYHSLLKLSNYANIQIKDSLARLDGVGDVTFLGARDYSMRIWLNPDLLVSKNMTAADVVSSLREQNVQVAAGRLASPPVPKGQDFTYAINALGRLVDEEQFGQIIIRVGDDGQIVRLKDVARIELGAKNYDVNTYLDGEPTATIAIFQLPGANALETAKLVKEQMKQLKTRFPEGMEYKIVYDTTVFVEESINDVFHTLYEAIALVLLVVLVFLQTWRATIIPMIAVPVSLIGTFAFMAILGFSLNNLSLFGLVLAIGIVVDDAIVVVENVERNLAMGLSPIEAARKAMNEVTGAILAITLVLCSVFIPTAFMAGISGQFYRQFALTIAASTLLSTINSLTLSPALAALMLKPHKHGEVQEAIPAFAIAGAAGIAVMWAFGSLISNLTLTIIELLGLPEFLLPQVKSALIIGWGLRVGLILAVAVVSYLPAKLIAIPINRVLAIALTGFNWGFDRVTQAYTFVIKILLKGSIIVLIVYGGLMVLTVIGFRTVPAGFIPEQDKGYLVVNVQLPDGASLERTDELMAKLSKICLGTPGIDHVLSIPGYSILNSANVSNVGGMFVILKPFEERHSHELKSQAILRKLRAEFAKERKAIVVVFGPPSIDGLGNAGGFKLQVQDIGSLGLPTLQGAVVNLAMRGNQQPGMIGLFTSFTTNQPQLFVDVDRSKAKSLGVSVTDVFDTLQTYLGSSYANDFNAFNRTWQVSVQADQIFRLSIEDVGRLKVRNNSAEMVPLATLLTVKDVGGPALVTHYNMYPSAEINGSTLPGFSSGQAIAVMEELAKKELPRSMGSEWTELALQEILAGKDLLTVLVFPLGVLFVFLTLAAQYESWSLPFAIILIVPMCLFAAISGVWLRGMDNNIFTQIGLVVLVGLASKNAILIVEFAKQLQDEGRSRFDAAVEAARLRLRPIIMTSFAFILGVVPLIRAEGAGSEMRQALGTAVFFGMLGVTFFGILFTPVFYYTIRFLTDRSDPQPVKPASIGSTTGHNSLPS